MLSPVFVLTSVLICIAFSPVRGHAQYRGLDHQGAVASESSLCSAIGIDVLRDGGNAVDAVRFAVTFGITDWG